MARTSALLKKPKKAITSATADSAPKAEDNKSSLTTIPPTKASKPLKRKNQELEEEAVPNPTKDLVAPVKKAKTDASISKPTPAAVSKADKSESPKTKPTKKGDSLKEKSKPSSSKSTVAPLPTKETVKKSKTASDLPPSISRPIPSKSKSKPSKKKKEPSPELSESDNEEKVEAEEAKATECGEEDDHLHGFSSDDDEDSSDEDDDMNLDEAQIDVGKLPTIAKDDETAKRKLEKAKREPTKDHGVIYIGRLPHGFYEDQLKAYFSQFGEVTRLRVSRNKKTGKSKHYAFLEFDSSAVAKIVADTMDNYLLTGHILRCKVIPKEEVHPALWVGANRKWRTVPRDRVTRVNHNKERTEEEQERATKRLLRRQNKKKQRLADMGVKYDLDAVGYKMPKEVTV